MRYQMIIWVLVAFSGCRSADDPGGKLDEGDFGGDGDNDADNDSDSDTDGDDDDDGDDSEWDKLFISYNCVNVEDPSCDSVACSYQTSLAKLAEYCSEGNEHYCDDMKNCFERFLECLGDVCGPGEYVKRSDWEDVQGCEESIAGCIFDAEEKRNFPGIAYIESSLMPDKEGWLEVTADGFQGAWYTFSDKESDGDSFIEPQEGGAFQNNGDELCVEGEASETIDEDFETYWGAGFGIDLCSSTQDDDPPEMKYMISECPYNDQLVRRLQGVAFDVEGDWGYELRVLFKESGRDASAYVIVDSDATHVVALIKDADFWADDVTEESKPVDAERITAIQLQIPSDHNKRIPFELCVSNFVALLL